jgi:hypothetical protein
MRTNNMQAGYDRRFRWALVIAVAPALWLVPTVARAQKKGNDEPVPFATLKAYEVQEATDLKGQNPQDPILRLANAAIVGTASGGLCTPAGQNPCAFATQAVSRIPLEFGVGPLSGDFQVMFDTMLSGLLSDLVLVAKGSVQGILDLRPLLKQNPEPMALMKGRWKSKVLDARGTFSGAFLLPFPYPPCVTRFAYLDPVAGLQCLEPTETSLGRPVTKVVATFLKTGTFDPDDKDDDDANGHGRN